MAIMDTLNAAQGVKAIAALGSAFGLNAKQTEAVVAAIVPELTRKIERNTLSRGGLADIVQALGQGHHQAYLRDPALYRDPGAVTDGNGILDHLVGGKDGSRAVADRVERETGVDSAVIRRMLPIVAGMTMGGLSQEVQGAFGDILSRMGLPVPDERQMDGGVGGRLGIPDVSQLPGGNSGAGLPMDGSAPQPQARPQPRRTNPGGGLQMPDDLPQGGGDDGYGRRGSGGRSSAPFPQDSGSDNPYGDLADILRKGLGLPGGSGGPVIIRRPGSGSGQPFPMPGDQGGNQGGGGGLPFPMPGGQGGGIEIPGGSVGGGALWEIVRQVLGGAAGGFQSKGVMGWIIKAVLLRYGMTILRSIFGRVLGGR